MKGRFLSILLILVISVFGLTACNVIKDKTYEATVSECFEFTQREDGNYAISAKAGAEIPAKIKLPTEYNGSAVVEVKAEGFKNITTLTEVIIPVGYEIIGSEAFAFCTKLGTLNIGQFGGTSSVKTTIRNSAFKGCSLLTTVTLGDKVSVIDSYAFYETMITGLNCRGLTKIGACSFGNCSSLKSFYVPASLVDIHEDAFKGSEKVVFTVSDSNKKYGVADGKIVTK